MGTPGQLFVHRELKQKKWALTGNAYEGAKSTRLRGWLKVIFIMGKHVAIATARYTLWLLVSLCIQAVSALLTKIKRKLGLD